MAYWTTEEVAEFLDITVGQVYESRKRKEYPGVLGVRQGRELRFPQDLVEAGPQEPKTTNDATTALLWALEGIHKTLRAIHKELRAQADLDIHTGNLTTHMSAEDFMDSLATSRGDLVTEETTEREET